MSRTFLLSTESDPVGNAIASLLAETAGFDRISEDDDRLGEAGAGDVLLVGDSFLESDAGTVPTGTGFVQFLGCRPSAGLVGRLFESGSVVAGISPVIGPRVANRVAGFGGPLRVKPGASWGVIGLGEIGAEVIRKVTAQGSSVVIMDIRTPRLGLLAELNVRRYSLDLLVAGSDAISIHVHHGPTASPLISERELGLMKSTAVLINTSHPSVVDEKAVIEALSAGTLAGYATDCPGETMLATDESLASPGKLFITTNPLTNQVGAAQQIAKFIAANIQAFRDGSDIEGKIELVDFPVVGDPSFWSSKMSPRQD
jgi:hypothetical protein